MLLLQSPSSDPYFNLAAEEYLLKRYTENIAFLYIDSPSVIVGKHQNTRAEANSAFCSQNGISVARRISGGGTVYHDPGNLNFCFIENGSEGKLVDFRKFTAPIMEILQSLNIPVEFGGRNDLLVQGKKISGNAEHIYRQRTLHHGTLLFDAALHALKPAITSEGTYVDKAVKSRRSPVMNLKELLPDWNMQQFKEYLTSSLLKILPSASLHFFSQNEILQIEQMAEEKFRSWDWIYAYSPRYSMQKTIHCHNQSWQISLQCDKGIIVELTISSSVQDPFLHSSLPALLKGKRLHEAEIFHLLEDQFHSNNCGKKIIEALF